MRAGERSVRTERVALEAFCVLVEVEMTSVLQAEVRAAGEHQWEVGIAVAVAVAHAASEEGHRGAQERLATEVLGLGEPSEEVAELLDGEGVVVGKLFHVAQIAAVVAELVARLGNADLGNSKRIPFAPQAEGGHARDIRLEGEHDQVIDGAEIITRHDGGDVAVGALAVGVGDSGERCVEPRIGPPRADLRLSNGGEVLFHASLVLRPHLCIEPPHFREVGVQDAAFAAQGTPLSRLAAFRFFEQGCEHITATTQRGKLDTIRSPGEGALREGDLHRGVTGVRGRDLSHLLVQGDRIAIRGPHLAAGQPDIDAAVVMTEGSRVMQAADGGDHFAVLLQRLQRTREFVVFTRLGDLVVERMDAVGEVDESAAPRRGGLFLGRSERDHAFQHGQ